MVIKADPENKQGQMEPALYLMAQATYAMRQYQPTLAVLDKYEEKFPEGTHTADFMLLRAQLNLENNDDDSARSTLKRFLEAYPEHPKAELVRRHLSEN
jgi:outer membrane protein assembly factor BamD (BamD/ComL family)